MTPNPPTRPPRNAPTTQPRSARNRGARLAHMGAAALVTCALWAGGSAPALAAEGESSGNASALASGSSAISGRSLDPISGAELVYRTHVDAAHIAWDSEAGRLDVQVVDGQTPRPASEVAIRLGPDADGSGREVSRLKITDSALMSFLGEPGDIVWNAPQQYYAGWPPVWAGFGASSHFPADIDPATVGLELVGVDGPGWMSVWRGAAGFAQEDWHSTRSGQIQKMAPGSHGHFNWSFSEPGRYTVTWRAHASRDDGTPLVSEPINVLWLVGPDSAVGLPEGTTSAAPISVPAEEFPVGSGSGNGGTQPGTGEPGAGDGGGTDNGGQPAGPDAELPDREYYSCLAPGHMDMAARSTSLDDLSAVLIDSSNPSNIVERESYSALIPVPDRASTTLDPSGAFAALAPLGGAGTKIWTLPETQDPSLAWLGVNTERVNYEGLRRLRIRQDGSEGPGAWLAWDSTLTDGAQVLLDSQVYESSFVASEPTHRHMNFSFNYPGIYSVNIDFFATSLETGEEGMPQTNYASYVVYFAVGDEAIERACGAEAVTPGEPATPVDPEPTDPEPTDPEPAEPGPSDPAPGDPVPSDPNSSNPVPSDPASGILPSTGSTSPADPTPALVAAPPKPARPAASATTTANAPGKLALTGSPAALILSSALALGIAGLAALRRSSRRPSV